MISFFLFNVTATTEIYTLSLHDALPIWRSRSAPAALGTFTSRVAARAAIAIADSEAASGAGRARSEEHTSELQSQFHLVCRLLLEKKNRERTVLCEERLV